MYKLGVERKAPSLRNESTGKHYATTLQGENEQLDSYIENKSYPCDLDKAAKFFVCRINANSANSNGRA